MLEISFCEKKKKGTVHHSRRGGERNYKNFLVERARKSWKISFKEWDSFGSLLFLNGEKLVKVYKKFDICWVRMLFSLLVVLSTSKFCFFDE